MSISTPAAVYYQVAGCYMLPILHGIGICQTGLKKEIKSRFKKFSSDTKNTDFSPV